MRGPTINRLGIRAPGNTMLLGQLGHAYGLVGRTARAREILGRMQPRTVASSRSAARLGEGGMGRIFASVAFESHPS
jgi:hypothetical protein